jgi:hypothetical protein
VTLPGRCCELEVARSGALSSVVGDPEIPPRRWE